MLHRDDYHGVEMGAGGSAEPSELPLASQQTLSGFLAAFFPDEYEPVRLRVFAPKKAPGDEARFTPRRVVASRHALETDSRLQEQLRQLNATRGVYFVVNTGGETDAEITRFNAWFVEDDSRPIGEQHRRLDAAPLPPSIRVETRQSVHAYWPITGGCGADEWRDIQQRLIAHFGGDEKIKNPSRVMRLPYFNHVYYDSETGALSFKRVSLFEFDPRRRFTPEEMRAAFAPVSAPEPRPAALALEAPHDAGGFTSWDELHAEAARRVRGSPGARTDGKGWTHAPGICHGSAEGKAQFVSPDGAYGCHKRCAAARVRTSHGLPERPNTQEPETGSGDAQPKAKQASRFTFTPLDELLAEPEEETAYVWDRTLPRGGFSICAAKPKVGKSTLARNLAVAVSRGADFFGRPTVKGKVIYLCLEEKRAEIARHFRLMGASCKDILIYSGRTPEDALAALEVAIEEHAPLLIIIDPLSRFVRVADFNSYGEVTRALEPLIDLARASECQCHIMAVHHNGKGEREGGDALLGSTGFFGAVDTLLTMRRREHARTLQTVQRYGEDMPETVAHLDAESGIVTPGGDLAALQVEDRKREVLEAMGDESLTEPDIRERVGGNQTMTAKAIRALYESGVLTRNGGGRRGDPYHYQKGDATSEKSSILDLTGIDNPENRENRESDEPEWLVDTEASDWMKGQPDEVREYAALLEYNGCPSREAERLARESYAIAA